MDAHDSEMMDVDWPIGGSDHGSTMDYLSDRDRASAKAAAEVYPASTAGIEACEGELVCRGSPSATAPSAHTLSASNPSTLPTSSSNSPASALYPDYWRPQGSTLPFPGEPGYPEPPRRQTDSYVGAGPVAELCDLFTNAFGSQQKPPALPRAPRALRIVEMADVESRPRDRGYRGGDRERGFKRRRYSRDEFDDERRPTRRRYDDRPVNGLRKALLGIAESPVRDVYHEVNTLAGGIMESWEDAEVKEAIVDLLLQLVQEQPFKTPFLAAVILHVNNSKPEIAVEVIKKAATRTQAAFDTGSWREVKLYLRLFAALSSLFEGDGVFPILDELFNRAADLQAASQLDAVGLELVKIIQLTIPYIIASPATGLESKVAEILGKTEVVASMPHALEALVEPYSGDETERPFGYQSFIGLLQRQLQAEQEAGWPLVIMPRPYKPIKKEGENGTEEPAATTKHVFPTITVPSPVNPGSHQYFPEAYFSLYADQDVESVPRTDNIASTLIRDNLVDTINLLDYNRIATAKFLIDLDCYWAPNTFVKRGTPFDKLREVESGQSTWKPEDMAVDAVFAQIFQLPQPPHKLIYYHSLITESCKIAPAAIAPSLGRAIRFLFRHLPYMDIELLHRFLDWFAHHLSNFEFRWKWTEWLEDLPRPDVDPRKAFVIGALEKEIRLSFAKRIRDTLPEQYHPLIPPIKEKDTPDYKYANDQTPYAAEGRQILALIKKKAPDTEIGEVIDSIHKQETEQGVSDPLVASTDALVTSICFTGSASLSHVLSCIERNKERLLNIGPQSETARQQVIESVVNYWEHRLGTAVTLVDKLINYGIVSPQSVISWALGSERLGNGIRLSKIHIYEVVVGTMTKVTHRLRQVAAYKVQAAKAAKLGNPLPEEQVAQIEERLSIERDGMRQLFALIDDAVSGLAAGAADGFIEADAFTDEEARLVKVWGERWARVFRRKSAVEEAVVGEDAIAASIALAEAEAEKEQLKQTEEPMETEEEVNGNENGDGNGDATKMDEDAP